MSNDISLSIVTPVHNKAPFIKAWLHSLVDQDIFDRMEVIAVENGSTDDSWKVLNREVNKLSAKTRQNIKVIQIDKANACIARNEGMKLSTGRYVSFLPADAFLFPGMARIWVEGLDEFPEYGFMYGGYRLAPPNGGVFYAEKYDVDLLRQYNYIDGSFPFKRELFPEWNNGGWDPDIKSLQDWDFWLAVVLGKDHKGTGIKGLYRPEIHFETIPPVAGGLSDDSHKNWVERTKQIKDKWGITESDICVTSPGAGFHAKNVAKILGAEYRSAPQFKPNTFKMIYEIGYYPQLAQQCSAVFTTSEGKLFPGKKVIHWVGSDVFGLLNSSYMNIKNLKRMFEANNFIHLVEFDQTKAELAELGINARVVPLPPAKLYEPLPLPKKFTVGVYMPETNKDFYYPDLMEQIAEKLPEYDFLFFGNPYMQTKKKNVTYVGEVTDMEKVIKDCSAIVRLTVHDGLPLSLVEFVTAGRNALFNIKMPHMVYANSSNLDFLVQRVKDLEKLPLNEAGSKYYRELMDHDKYRKTIQGILEEASYEPKTYWENRAEGWNRQAPTGDLPHLKEVEEMLKDTPYQSVIDIGCGNGRWSEYFNDKEYLGTDISEKLINLAKQAYKDKDFAAVKLEDLELDKRYDLAFVYTCLQHIKPEDLPVAVEKIKKLAKTILLIESPEGWDGSYGFNHDYNAHFNIVKELKADVTADNPNGTLTFMLIENE